MMSLSYVLTTHFSDEIYKCLKPLLRLHAMMMCALIRSKCSTFLRVVFTSLIPQKREKCETKADIFYGWHGEGGHLWVMSSGSCCVQIFFGLCDCVLGKSEILAAWQIEIRNFESSKALNLSKTQEIWSFHNSKVLNFKSFFQKLRSKTHKNQNLRKLKSFETSKTQKLWTIRNLKSSESSENSKSLNLQKTQKLWIFRLILKCFWTTFLQTSTALAKWKKIWFSFNNAFQTSRIKTFKFQIALFSDVTNKWRPIKAIKRDFLCAFSHQQQTKPK